MKLGSAFHVPAAPATVLEKFLDAPTMRACIPGCTELERPDPLHFRGRLTNEVAHVRFDAAFAVEITELDAPHTVRAVLTGEDSRLGSSLKVDASLDVTPAGDGSDVTYGMEMAMWGRLGRLGESIFRRRTAEVEKQFLQAFARACAGEDVAALAAPAAVAAPARTPAPAVAVPAAPAYEPVPLVAGAVSAPAMSALPGVPLPAAPAVTPVTPVTPDEAAARATASLRPLGAEGPPARPARRTAIALAAAAASVVLAWFIGRRAAGR